MNAPRRPTILTVAGLDPCGRAGVAADLRAIDACGGHGAAIVTVLTIQDGRGVRRLEVTDPELIEGQLESVLAREEVRAVKTGALGDEQIVRALACALEGRGLPLVVDPVVRATGGGMPMGAGSVEAPSPTTTSAGRSPAFPLGPLATLVTPNLPEAEAVLGHPIDTPEAMERAAAELAAAGPAILLKGGHLAGDDLCDVLATRAGVCRLVHRRLPDLAPGAMRGTGCRLASAIATFLGRGFALVEAIVAAGEWLRADLRRG